MIQRRTMDKFGPDGVRIDGAGHLIWEGVETTIDGPDWVAVVLTYGPDRRALETVRRRLAAEASACPVPGRCGLFLHATDCPRRQAPRESTIVPVNDSGELECTCGSNQIQELGQIAPGGLWWYHVGQNAATRVLRVGGWDWEGADGTGFECRDCHAEYDVLPEGWDVDYV